MDSDRVARKVRAVEDSVERALGGRRVLAAALVLLSAWVFALRYLATSAHESAGPDYGHYLIAQNWYALNDHSGEGPFDPPVVPLLLSALAAPLGRMGALQAAGPLAAAALVPSAYFMVSRFAPRWAGLAVAVNVALWQQFTEFMMFGGVTNLLGMAVGYLVFRSFFDATESPPRGVRPSRRDIVCALMLVLLLSVHHLTAFVTGATLVLWVAVRAVADPPGRRAFLAASGRIFAMAAAGGSVYVPYLLSILDSEVAAGLGQPTQLGLVAFFPTFAFRDNMLLWAAFLILALLGLARIRAHAQLFAFAVAVLAAPALMAFTFLSTHPLRAMFFEPFALAAVAAVWASRDNSIALPRLFPRKALAALRAIFLGLVLLGATLLSAAAPAQAERAISQYHQYLTPGLLEAFEWVAANSDPSDTVAVDRSVAGDFNERWKGMATGWWLEGWANRKAIYEANPVLLPFKPKWDDTRAANRFFDGINVLENGHLRVADNFPDDDAALPRVLTGYLQDYHEFVGFSSPRLLNVSSGASLTLDDAAQAGATMTVEGSTGTLAGDYAGADFVGHRLVRFEAGADTVGLSMSFTLSPGAAWDTLEVSLTIPPWIAVDTARLSSGLVPIEARDVSGAVTEAAELTLGGRNVTAAQAAPPYLSPGETGFGLRVGIENESFEFNATLRVSRLTPTAPGAHALAVMRDGEVLVAKNVRFLLVGTDSAANIQRFERDPARFARVFANAAAVVYRVL